MQRDSNKEQRDLKKEEFVGKAHELKAGCKDRSQKRGHNKVMDIGIYISLWTNVFKFGG